MKKSNCCGVPLIDETDVCSKCKEHCEAVGEEIDYSWLLKQFDKADLVKTLGVILTMRNDEVFTKVITNDLHWMKYSRLVDIDSKKVEEYKAKYAQYEGKTIPQKLSKVYNKFVRALENNRKTILRQREIMKDLGLIKEKVVS